jgi:hypothetical protein
MGVDYDEATLNFYKHEECAAHWADLWSCGCNDKCPKCGAEIEPYASLAANDIEVGMANIPR